MEFNPCFQKSFWLKPYKDQTKTVSVAKVSATNMVPREKLKGFMSWKKKELLSEKHWWENFMDFQLRQQQSKALKRKQGNKTNLIKKLRKSPKTSSPDILCQVRPLPVSWSFKFCMIGPEERMWRPSPQFLVSCPWMGVWNFQIILA